MRSRILSLACLVLAAAVAVPMPARAAPVRAEATKSQPLLDSVTSADRSAEVALNAFALMSRDIALRSMEGLATRPASVPTLRSALQLRSAYTGRVTRDVLPRRDRLL